MHRDERSVACSSFKNLKFCFSYPLSPDTGSRQEILRLNDELISLSVCLSVSLTHKSVTLNWTGVSQGRDKQLESFSRSVIGQDL